LQPTIRERRRAQTFEPGTHGLITVLAAPALAADYPNHAVRNGGSVRARRRRGCARPYHRATIAGQMEIAIEGVMSLRTKIIAPG
jgi:hypothetical protein